MSQVQKDLAVIIPALNERIVNLTDGDFGMLFYGFNIVGIVEDVIDKEGILGYEELEDALLTYVEIKYNKRNMLFGFLK